MHCYFMLRCICISTFNTSVKNQFEEKHISLWCLVQYQMNHIIQCCCYSAADKIIIENGRNINKWYKKEIKYLNSTNGKNIGDNKGFSSILVCTANGMIHESSFAYSYTIYINADQSIFRMFLNFIFWKYRMCNVQYLNEYMSICMFV